LPFFPPENTPGASIHKRIFTHLLTPKLNVFLEDITVVFQILSDIRNDLSSFHCPLTGKDLERILQHFLTQNECIQISYVAEGS
jgi:hypothetical protein